MTLVSKGFQGRICIHLGIAYTYDSASGFAPFSCKFYSTSTFNIYHSAFGTLHQVSLIVVATIDYLTFTINYSILSISIGIYRILQKVYLFVRNRYFEKFVLFMETHEYHPNSIWPKFYLTENKVTEHILIIMIYI